MIKLLKYDLKRNATLLLGGMAILLLCEFVLLWSRATDEVKIVLSVLFFGAVSVIYFISSLRVFDYNISTVSRRLVPVGALSYVGASLLYGLLNSLVMTVIGAAFTAYMVVNLGGGFSWAGQIPVWAIVLIIVEYLFLLVYGFLTFYMTIALARSLVTKGVFWVGLLIFIVLTIVLSYVEDFLFGQDSSALFGSVDLQWSSQSGVLARELPGLLSAWQTWGSIVFEGLLCVAFLYVIKWCIEKKIEAR
ncbi:hypothetical protein BCV73_26445 [Paenibacillus sp. SSG-1]|uniref:hypothetical protein n=1 Tax=Paenibacillus sp. SSG-1 TaxID=1443669 RepID=UPI000B7C5AC6|nr:hypothetical protein [Paenibacillus sp. SSG-1]OXL86227.1 hypothetical protein BCV73_26445 [Paenibacillus sp. SSG-1]